MATYAAAIYFYLFKTTIMTIQMIPTSEDNSIFIINYNMKTNELTFRTTRVPEHLQTEKLQKGVNGMLHTNLDSFHESYLSKFIVENELINHE